MPQKTSPTLSILCTYPADQNVKTTKKALVPSMRGACRLVGGFCASWLSSQRGSCPVHVSTQLKTALRARGGAEKPTAWGICFWGLAPTGLLFLSVSLWLFFLRTIHEAADQPQMPGSFEIFNQPLHGLKSWRRHPATVLNIAEDYSELWYYSLSFNISSVLTLCSPLSCCSASLSF